MWLPILFAPTETSQAAGHDLRRPHHRPHRPRRAVLGSVRRRPARRARGVRRRQGPQLRPPDRARRLPVLVVNGTDDIVIPTINSYILQHSCQTPSSSSTRTPTTAPHFQYPELFLRHARIFLDEQDPYGGELMMTDDPADISV